MKIGIFDSGLGGLMIGAAIIKELPQYDYVYLGDTKRVPYGNRSQETIYDFTREALEFLFQKQCQLVIVACNTASAEALRRIQQEFLPTYYPDRRVLGVLVPTAELVSPTAKQIGILATASTVQSGAFLREIAKISPQAKVIQQAAPLLVPLIENNGLEWVEPILQRYLQPLAGSDVIILGCTHYVAVKDLVRKLVPTATVIAQDELVPNKVKDYLTRHPEITEKLTENASRHFLVTDLSEICVALAKTLNGGSIELERALL